VRKYLRSNLPPEFHPRDYTRIIDPYVDNIKEMIQKGYIGTKGYMKSLLPWDLMVLYPMSTG